MIAKLKGCVDSVFDHYVIFDVNGVGYQLFCSHATIKALREAEGICTLHVEMVVRQDLIQLYGFWSAEEKDLFKILINVQGVGMKVGLALLSIAEPYELIHAIASGDQALLSRADGVGPKLASRLVNELKDKVGGLSNVIAINTKGQAPSKNHVMHDAVSILKNLGYRQNEAEQAVNLTIQTSPEASSVEEVIKISLSKLSRM